MPGLETKMAGLRLRRWAAEPELNAVARHNPHVTRDQAGKGVARDAW
jgi:hypothetical protein